MKAEGKTELKLGEGEWRVEKGDLNGKYFLLDKPTKISGQERGKTTLVGFSLLIKGNESEGIVEIEDLTIKGGEEYGLYAYKGMNVIMRGCTVEECQKSGVYAYHADISCVDLQVVGCGESGVWAYNNATITLSGQGTNIQRNVTKGRSDRYGLHVSNPSSSKIHLVLPLAKEQISTNNGGGGLGEFWRKDWIGQSPTDNGGGGNWGGDGTIEQIGGGSPVGETKSDSTTPPVSLILFSG